MDYELLKANIPVEMQTSHRWGLIKNDKSPLGGGAPEWHYTLDEAITEHQKYITKPPYRDKIHKNVLGYCFGGVSNMSTKPASDPDHGNLTAEEAKTQGKPVDALYMEPDPHYGCIDYDHVIRDGQLRDDLPQELIYEITTFNSVYYTEISSSGTGLHIIFEKNEDFPHFTKTKNTFEGEYGREIFSEIGYVNFTGNYINLGGKSTSCENAYKSLIIIVNKTICEKTTKNPIEIENNTKKINDISIEEKHKITSIITSWKKNEINRIALQTQNIDITDASSVMQSVMNRIAGDAADDALKNGIDYNAYVDQIIPIWETTDHYKNLYGSGQHEYNESKIQITLKKAVEYGRTKYDRNDDINQDVITEFETRHLDMFLEDYHRLHQGDDIVLKLILCQRISTLINNTTSICIQVIGESQNGKTHAVDSVIPLVGKLYGKTRPYKNKKGEIEDGTEFNHPAIYSASFTDKAIYRMKDVVADNTILRIDDVEINDTFADVFKGAFKRNSTNTRICTNSINTSRVDILECPLNLQFIISGVSPWIVDEQTKNRTLFVTVERTTEREAEIDRLTKMRFSGESLTIDDSKYISLWNTISNTRYTVDVNGIWDFIQMPDAHMRREKETLVSIVMSLTILNHWERGKTEYVSGIDDLKEAVGLFNQTFEKTTDIDYTGMRPKLRAYAHAMMNLDAGRYTIDELYTFFKKNGLNPSWGNIKSDLLGRSMRGKHQDGLIEYLPTLTKRDIMEDEKYGNAEKYVTERGTDVVFVWKKPKNANNLKVTIVGVDGVTDSNSSIHETVTDVEPIELMAWTTSRLDGQATIHPELADYIPTCEEYNVMPRGSYVMTIAQKEDIRKYTISGDDITRVCDLIETGHITYDDAVLVGQRFKGK